HAVEVGRALVPRAVEDAPAVGGEARRDAVEQRRLAGARLADDADHLAGPEVERNIAAGLDRAEALREPLHLEQRRVRLRVDAHFALPPASDQGAAAAGRAA